VKVTVDWDPARWAMRETAESRAEIEWTWTAATAAQPRLWNQSKYRLAGAEGWLEDRGPLLRVGLTDYKDHMGTNLGPEVDRWVGEGPARWDMMAQCIGVGCWLLSTDGKVVMVETAGWKGEQGCRVDRPGGHAEPEESLALLPEAGRTLAGLTPQLVRRELFECIQKEVRDEINIPLESQGRPELLGVVVNTEKGGRLGLEFLIRVQEDSGRIRELYTEGGPEADESTNIFFIPLEEITEDRIDPALATRFTPHAKGSIQLFKWRISGQTKE
jgi:hypothetical protein